MNNPKLYDTLTETELNDFLKHLGTTLEAETLTEILEPETDFYGDFIVYGGYKFKKTYGVYSCMQTPTEKHQKNKKNIMFTKAKNDHYENK
jgi:hypothetical protein